MSKYEILAEKFIEERLDKNLNVSWNERGIILDFVRHLDSQDNKETCEHNYQSTYGAMFEIICCLKCNKIKDIIDRNKNKETKLLQNPEEK